MIYFQAKRNLEEAILFSDSVVSFWELEDSMYEKQRQRNQWKDEDEKEYQELRAVIARKTPLIARLARSNGVHADLQSYPPPAVGGPVIPVNLFYAILNDDSHGGVDRQRIVDTINELVGQLDDRKKLEFRAAVNPFHWLGVLIELLLSLPFWVVSKTGFDVSKIEDNLWGKLFKIIEVAALGYLAIKYGLPIGGTS